MKLIRKEKSPHYLSSINCYILCSTDNHFIASNTKPTWKIMIQFFPVTPLLTPSLSYYPGKVKGLYDAQAPACPVCQAVLRPGELQEHMEQELTKLAQLQIRYHNQSTNVLHSCYNSVHLLPLSLFNIMAPSGFIVENHVLTSSF